MNLESGEAHYLLSIQEGAGDRVLVPVLGTGEPTVGKESVSAQGSYYPAGGGRSTVPRMTGLGHLTQFEGGSGRREQMTEWELMAKDTLFKVSAQSFVK